MIKFFVPAPVTEYKLGLARRLYGPDDPLRGGRVVIRWVGTKPETETLKRQMRFAGFWKHDDVMTVSWSYGHGPVPGVWVTIKEERT